MIHRFANGQNHSGVRAITLIDPALDLDAKSDHKIHPIESLGTIQVTCKRYARGDNLCTIPI